MPHTTQQFYSGTRRHIVKYVTVTNLRYVSILLIIANPIPNKQAKKLVVVTDHRVDNVVIVLLLVVLTTSCSNLKQPMVY